MEPPVIHESISFRCSQRESAADAKTLRVVQFWGFWRTCVTWSPLRCHVDNSLAAKSHRVAPARSFLLPSPPPHPLANTGRLDVAQHTFRKPSVLQFLGGLFLFYHGLHSAEQKGRAPVQVLCPYFYWIVSFVIVEFEQFFGCFESKPLFANIVSHSVACLFILATEFSFEWSSTLSFSLMVCTPGCCI